MKILVLCTGNSCRSQMAEAYIRLFGTEKNIEVYSAGIEAHGLNPRAVKVLAEDSLDITNQTSDKIDKYLGINFDLVLTVCDNAKENCPFIPGNHKIIHHSFEDPAKATGTEEEILESFRKVRDEIKVYCYNLINN